MKDRREESMLSNCLSDLLEIRGRDKVTSFVSDHETGQNSRTAVRRRRLRVGGSHWGQLPPDPGFLRNPPVVEGKSGCG